MDVSFKRNFYLRLSILSLLCGYLVLLDGKFRNIYFQTRKSLKRVDFNIEVKTLNFSRTFYINKNYFILISRIYECNAQKHDTLMCLRNLMLLLTRHGTEYCTQCIKNSNPLQTITVVIYIFTLISRSLINNRYGGLQRKIRENFCRELGRVSQGNGSKFWKYHKELFWTYSDNQKLLNLMD